MDMKFLRNVMHSNQVKPLKLKSEECFTGKVRPNPTILGVLKQYCKNSTIHGLRYISRDGSSLSDRLCWVAAVISCIVLAGVFVSSAWQKFSQSPIVVNVETTNYPLYKIPFPSVTICPSTNVKRRLAEKILARLLNRTLDMELREELKTVMSALSEMQYPFYHRAGEQLSKVNPSYLPLLDTITLSQFMLQVLPTCREMFRACYWTGRDFDCCKGLSLQRSEAGYCYSFNSLTAEDSINCSTSGDQFFQFGEHATKDNTCNPRRNIAGGTSTGLEIFLAKISEEDTLVDGQLDPNGTRIMINHPMVPPESATSLYVPERPSTFYSVKVSPTITMASTELKDMDISQRKCLFPNEGKSSYFKVYTFQGCIIECRLRFIINKCKCVPYFYDSNIDGVPECKFSQIKCLEYENANMRVFNPPNGENIYGSEVLNCSNCLPTCHESTYNLDHDITPDTNPYTAQGIAHLDIFFKDLGGIKYRRERAFNEMQLIVSFGGILGLFLGISLLSGAELIYYLLKMCKVLHVRHRTKSSSTEQDLVQINRVIYPSRTPSMHSNLQWFRAWDT